MLRILWSLACAALAYGQTFDVASVKPAAPPGANRPAGRQIHGGPGSTDPGTVTFTNADMMGLLTLAFEIRPYQVVGPDWLSATRFDITARLPPGTTVAEYRAMLRHLLQERFALATHNQQKEVPGFDLVVAKGGPKLTKSPDDEKANGDGTLQPPASAPQPPAGYRGELSLRLVKSTMEHFAAFLSGVVGQPVHDATGIAGQYDIHLQYSAAGLQPELAPGNNSLGSPLEALPEQLGLRLMPRKQTIDLLVIDRLGKTPTEN